MTHGAEINFRAPTSRRDMIKAAIIAARHQRKDRFEAVNNYLPDPEDRKIIIERVDSAGAHALWRDAATGEHWILDPQGQLQPAQPPTPSSIEATVDDDALAAATATTRHDLTDNDTDDSYDPRRDQIAQWHDDQIDAVDQDESPFDGTFSEP
ncbi:hypothetical protein [Nocardia suismassiliense]|uniref:hypothetical protein n=1 Tax=Nocardia suismassiliense TaxID=2077092 RepID=UPI000D1D6D12|nr:hypothetical protein [Nocardia suismassiliense]